MPFTLNGDFGAAVFSSAADDAGRVTSRYVSLSTEADLNFFRKISIVKSSIVLNSMGLFSFQQAGNNNKVRFAHLTKPKHMFTKRSSGCVWNPKGRILMNQSEITVDPLEYNGEHCPDEFYGSCLEKFYGTGNQVRDIFGTPAGAALFGELVNRVYEGLGDSFYELIWYGMHPIIEDADANDWFTVDDDQWDAFKDQQAITGGIMTIIDAFKEDGLANFNVQINTSDISDDRESYVGDPSDLFDRVLRAQSSEMKIMSKRGSNGQGSMKTVILCDSKIYAAYEQQLSDDWRQIPETFHYYYNGKFCEAFGCSDNTHVEGTLKYKGHLVVCMDEWDDFDTITGTNTFRCLAVVPGNFGVAYDVPTLDDRNGFGLNFTQKLEAPYKGKVYLDTTFKAGTGIIDEKFIVNASRTFNPA